MASLVVFRKLFTKLLDGYGSFFGLKNPASKVLLLICAMLNPVTGLLGMLGGLLVILFRRLIGFPLENESVEIVNGVLLGMLLGSLYAPDACSLLLLACGAVLVVLLNAVLGDTVGRHFRLPVLGLPYVAAAFILLPLAVRLPLVPSYALSLVPANMAAMSGSNILSGLGAIYFNGTWIGGILAFAGLFLSSRYIAILALGAACVCALFLTASGIAFPPSLSYLIAQMNGVLTAVMIGGLYTAPGRRSVIVALSAAILASALSVCGERLLWGLQLPVLALPFVLATYATLIALSPIRGGPWLLFWLAQPALPEESQELVKVAEARGVDVRSVGLKAPFQGLWQVYQGFDGEFTHKGAWQYALDFFQTVDGVSFKGDGAVLEDYFAYGKPILSPAYGWVVDVVNHLPDNRPGEVDCVNNWGNYILIKLDCGLYVLLAHLKKESVKVVNYARVSPGQLIGCLGNSGRSLQPHLHIQVQETAYLGSRTVPFHLSGVIESDDQTATYTLTSRPSTNTHVLAPVRNAALKRALHLNVGNQIEFDFIKGKGKRQTAQLEVTLDLFGQLWLKSKTDARVALSATDDLVAFYNRRGPKDRMLDCVILAVGLTPLVEGTVSWMDRLPRRILPMPLLMRVLADLLHPFDPCAISTYRRTWNGSTQTWTQVGIHSVSFGLFQWSCTTEAKLCEKVGLVSLNLVSNGRPDLHATLAGYGLREDNGIPDRMSLWTPSY